MNSFKATRWGRGELGLLEEPEVFGSPCCKGDSELEVGSTVGSELISWRTVDFIPRVQEGVEGPVI